MPNNESRQQSRIDPQPGEVIDRRTLVEFEFDGRQVKGYQGDTIASALYAAGNRVFSRSFKYHRPRGLLCCSGNCPNCLVTVGDEPNVRACTRPHRTGPAGTQPERLAIPRVRPTFRTRPNALADARWLLLQGPAPSQAPLVDGPAVDPPRWRTGQHRHQRYPTITSLAAATCTQTWPLLAAGLRECPLPWQRPKQAPPWC